MIRFLTKSFLLFISTIILISCMSDIGTSPSRSSSGSRGTNNINDNDSGYETIDLDKYNGYQYLDTKYDYLLKIEAVRGRVYVGSDTWGGVSQNSEANKNNLYYDLKVHTLYGQYKLFTECFYLDKKDNKFKRVDFYPAEKGYYIELVFDENGLHQIRRDASTGKVYEDLYYKRVK